MVCCCGLYTVFFFDSFFNGRDPYHNRLVTNMYKIDNVPSSFTFKYSCNTNTIKS